MNNVRIPVITIDGPSGTGKGTLSLHLAKTLHWHFLDSGVIYRVLAFAALQHGVPLTAIASLVAISQSLNLVFSVDKEENPIVLLENVDITKKIRTEQCGQAASIVAAIAEVRMALLARQRAFAEAPGLVADGRDMGTVVFPEASLKIFLDAGVEERAKRRFLQLKENGNNVSLAQVIDELIQRDARDRERACCPLKPAADAVLIDTTGLTVVQVLYNVLQLVRERIPSSAHL